MDMNRKSRFGLKNKNTQMVASVMQKIIMVFSFFVMMAVTAHAGPFLNDFTNSTGVVNDTVRITGVNGGQIDVPVINRRRPTTETIPDTWSSTPSGYTGYTSSDYEGYYIGTFGDNNDSEEGLVDLIEYFLGTTITDPNFLKVDEPNFTDIDDLTLTLEYDSDNYSGTWKITGGANEDANKINFYSVKGAQEYALYYVDPANHEGDWTTAHLRTPGTNPSQPNISHLSVLLPTSNTPSNPDAVPEPATMLLFGFSLIGLAGMARRKNSKF